MPKVNVQRKIFNSIWYLLLNIMIFFFEYLLFECLIDKSWLPTFSVYILCKIIFHTFKYRCGIKISGSILLSLQQNLCKPPSGVMMIGD
jgi:hypothetical protein